MHLPLPARRRANVIAALFVATGGAYFGLTGVEPWDAARDARKYAGPYPVVAHPPCTRWCRLAGLVEARWGHRRGDDGGCFESALTAVRRFGGVLEHPAHTRAWKAYDIPTPPTTGGWIACIDGGWTCQVEQGNYGHPCRKATWLYAYGLVPPTLIWGPSTATQWIGHMKNRSTTALPRATPEVAMSTPAAFRDLLLSIAHNCIALG
jgi:hypothetical protein